jgi:hypothetical protein
LSCSGGCRRAKRADCLACIGLCSMHVPTSRRRDRSLGPKHRAGRGVRFALLGDMRRTLETPGSRTERAIGRSIALCAHPYAAWRTGTTATRTMLWIAYFGGSYAACLMALQLLSPQLF